MCAPLSATPGPTPAGPAAAPAPAPQRARPAALLRRFRAGRSSSAPAAAGRMRQSCMRTGRRLLQAAVPPSGARRRFRASRSPSASAAANVGTGQTLRAIGGCSSSLAAVGVVSHAAKHAAAPAAAAQLRLRNTSTGCRFRVYEIVEAVVGNSAGPVNVCRPALRCCPAAPAASV